MPKVIALAHFIVALISEAFKPLGPIFTDYLGIDIGVFASLLAILEGLAAFTQILWGYVADRIKKEGLFGAFLLLTIIVASALLGFSRNATMLFILIFIIKMAHSAFHPLGASIAGKYLKGTHIAIFCIMGTLGAALSPLLFGWFVSRYTIKSLPILAGVIFIFALPTLIKLMGVEKESIPHHRPSQGSLWSIGALVLIVSIRALIMEIFHTYMPFYIKAQGGSPIRWSSILTGGIFIGMIFNYIGAHLSEKVSIRYINAIGFGTMAVAGVLFIESHTTLLQTLFFMLFDAGVFFTMSANITYAQSLSPHRKGMASASVMGLSKGIGNILAGAYAGVFGKNIVFMLSSGVLLSISMAIISLFILGNKNQGEIY